ncbi:MAG: fasciclin domain-containing protein [bacterium]|nr:fasciclin domain-containing protein [bacterium]
MLLVISIITFKFSNKRTYTIAFIGDSLVDTMQTSFPYLTESLHTRFPDVDFKLYNYGIGAETVETGLARFDQKLIYKDRIYLPLSTVSPDIIIIGSWAYNPFSPHNPQKHKNLLTEVVKKAQVTGAHVYLLEELAPLGADFAKGVGGVSFSKEEAIKHSERIIEQLQNAKDIAKSLNIPLIDIYDKTKLPASGLGQALYINQTDGIHPSPLGHRLTADMVALTVQLAHNNKSALLTKLIDISTNFVNIFSQQKPLAQLKPETTVGMGQMFSSKTIFNNLINANNLTSMSSVFRFTKLNIFLSSSGTYTVFVPDNNAFEKLPKDSFIRLITPGNEKRSIEQFSSYIVPGIYINSELKDGMTLKSIDGKSLKITKKGNIITINDKAQIETEEIKSSNGVMYVINSIL